MTIFKKNRDFVLHHVDLDTGYGLLYSKKNDECAFLNTLATALWKIPLDHVNPEREITLFAEVSRISEAAGYMNSVITGMKEKNLLIPDADDDKPCDSVPEKTKSQDHQLGQIYFYATRRCNARCYHCYQPTEKIDGAPPEAQNNQLSAASFLRFLEDALPLGVKAVKVTGGEPLLRTDLEEILRGIKGLGLGVSIETNGSLITEKIADLFAELAVRISISLDGGSAEVHDLLRGHPGSFDRVLHALKLLSDKGCQPQIIMAISSKNLGEIEAVLDIAASNKCRLVKLNPVNTLGTAHRLSGNKILLGAGELLALHRKRKEMESKFATFIYLEGPPVFSTIEEIVDGHAAICPFTGIIGVLADGSLSYCGIGNSHPELIYARIKENDFDIKEFWKKDGTPLARVRTIMSQKIQGICGSCILEALCKGSCRALAYTEFGSFSAPHPWCQNAYDEGLFPSHYLKPS